MISVSNLGKSFGDRTLFEGASFQLDPGQRYGLVGANGSGKTTLLGVLSGDEEASEGTVSIPKDLRLGVLRQDQFLYEEEEILGVALMGNPDLWHAMSEKEKLLKAAEENPEAPFDADRFSELEETVQLHDGYTAEARAARILEGLGIPADVHREPLSILSGGFKLRVLLAQVLASAPDVLLLDEPTNHLDILSIRWLETFLSEYAGPVVVISHDHRFLDNVATRILDVDYRTVTLYKGNYSRFMEAKREERERREKEIVSREKEIAHHQVFVDRFRAKASKARQAQSKLRMIEKKASELEALPGSSRRYPHFRFEPRRPSGKQVLEIEGIRKSYDDNEVLHGVDLEIRRGDRVAIIGPNGIGKSTLLRIAVGDVPADAGEVEWGHETHVGYFAQDHHEQISDEDRTIEEWLWDFCPGKDRGFVRGQLGMMLFSGDEGEKRLGALSGGEAARLVFARIALERPNVLVLDEPTNHLDMESIEALVEGLQSFDGTLILVSHDRWFVSRLATRIVEVRADGIRDYPGSYDEYVEACGDDHLDADAVVLEARKRRRQGDDEPPPDTRRRRSSGSSSNRRLKEATEERDQVTARITAIESRLEAIDATFCEPDFYERSSPDEVSALEAERADLAAEAETALVRWEALERELSELSDAAS
ncbi:ABC-F family ATP-binding cassette domain-containing protein [Gaopeijia maritima]|uniref:ABC-F family ATP-binding cassette domain-containing protein n=1 Tax=Gaopeijia maritima TaxID=3119007 RepID=A0ABU9E5W3_9BACT